MADLEFWFASHHCDECAFSYKGLAWGEASLVCKEARTVQQKLIFPVAKGSTVHGSKLFSYLEQLKIMYMSTTRGLTA